MAIAADISALSSSFHSRTSRLRYRQCVRERTTHRLHDHRNSTGTDNVFAQEVRHSHERCHQFREYRPMTNRYVITGFFGVIVCLFLPSGGCILVADHRWIVHGTINGPPNEHRCSISIEGLRNGEQVCSAKSSSHSCNGDFRLSCSTVTDYHFAPFPIPALLPPLKTDSLGPPPDTIRINLQSHDNDWRKQKMFSVESDSAMMTKHRCGAPYEGEICIGDVSFADD